MGRYTNPMGGRFAIVCLACVACSSTPEAPAADAGADTGVMPDVEVEAAPLPDCEPDTKLGNPMGTIALKTPRGTTMAVRPPPNYDPTVFSPLIMVYAPAVATALQTESFTGLTKPGNARGYVVAYVSHITPQTTADFADGAAAVTAVTDAWCIDPKRIYLTGHSDGGSMSEIIGVRSLVKMAAIAPSAAGVTGMNLAGAKCPATPTQVMKIHSINDGLFPPANGFGADAAKWWAKCAGCDMTPGPKDANGCITYPSCMDMVEVRYCETTGQHGQWPPLNAAMLDFFDSR
jgi:polyhydroxybutyrate depolymerase